MVHFTTGAVPAFFKKTCWIMGRVAANQPYRTNASECTALLGLGTRRAWGRPSHVSAATTTSNFPNQSVRRPMERPLLMNLHASRETRRATRTTEQLCKLKHSDLAM